MKPAAIGIGAAVSARAIRPSPVRAGRRSAATRVDGREVANSTKKIVLTVIPAIFGIALLNGTPKLDTYHQPLVEAKHSAKHEEHRGQERHAVA